MSDGVADDTNAAGGVAMVEWLLAGKLPQTSAVRQEDARPADVLSMQAGSCLTAASRGSRAARAVDRQDSRRAI